MTIIDIGKLKITHRGTYNSTTEYKKDDAVFFAGSSFVHSSNEPTTGIAPLLGTNTTTWNLMAAGAPDLANQGDILVRGESGPEALAAGPAGHVLTMGGAYPSWSSPPGRQNSIVVKLPDTNLNTGAYRSGGAIMGDGTIRVWGDGANASLGQGISAVDRASPVMPACFYTLPKIKKWVILGWDNWLLGEDGSVHVWGRNQFGQLAVGHTANVGVITRVTALEGINIVDIAVGHGSSEINYGHVMFLADNGDMWPCGYNAHGQLGLGDFVNRSTPERLTKNDWKSVVIAGCRYARTHAIDANDNLYSWGYQANGELGNGSFTASQNEPQLISLPGPCLQVSACEDDISTTGIQIGGHTLALLEDRRVASWGRGTSGQLGVGDFISYSSPQIISSLGDDNVGVYAAGGNIGFSVVEKEDGTIRTFGSNSRSQLGDGTTVNRSSPITPAGIAGHGGIRKILPFGGGDYGSLGVLFNDGELKAAGYNISGRLGLGDVVNRSTFETIPLNGQKVADICCVGRASEVGLGIRTEQGLYCQTGYNGEFQCGSAGGDSLVPYPFAF